MATLEPVESTGATWRAWVLAARPRTLPAALAPVLVGTALAGAEGRARPGPALAAALGALLLQIGANLANDLADFERGADTQDRRGPARAAQLGLLSPARLRAGTAVVFAAAALAGLYLIGVAGWPVAAIGALSILAALTYTGGPWPYGYHGLGDLAVFLFFGVVAVTGTHYVQALELSGRALLLSVPVGATVTAVLTVNNLRDLETDARAGKRTLAVQLGAARTQIYYRGLLGVALAAPVALWLAGPFGPGVLLALLCAPFMLGLARRVEAPAPAAVLNAALVDTARIHALSGALLAAGLLL